MLQMDFVGAVLMIGLIISFILALQYGGQTHSWDSSQVIGLLVGFVGLTAVFVLWEMFQKERAMIVPRLVCDYIYNDFNLADGATVSGALRLGWLRLHVLLRRRILCTSLLSSDLFPEHS